MKIPLKDTDECFESSYSIRYFRLFFEIFWYKKGRELPKRKQCYYYQQNWNCYFRNKNVICASVHRLQIPKDESFMNKNKNVWRWFLKLLFLFFDKWLLFPYWQLSNHIKEFKFDMTFHFIKYYVYLFECIHWQH